MTCLAQRKVRIWFLDPDDAAMFKCARNQPNDVRWIRAGVLAGLISPPKIKARVPTTVFLDDAEEALGHKQLAEDLAWFEAVKGARASGTPAGITR